MSSDLAAASAITKIGYGDIHDQLDDFVVALKFVDRGAKHISPNNTEVQFTARMARSQGIGARGENGTLPTAGQGKDARASIFLKYQYGRVQGTGQVFKQVTGNTSAFVDWMKREMTDIKESLNRDLNRQVYGDGTGTLALVSTGATTATDIIVDDVHFLEIDMYVDVLTAATLGNATPTKGNTAPLKITAIDETTSTITVSGGTVTALTGSALVRADSDPLGENNWKKEWVGLGSMLGTGVLHNIDPATFPRWKPGYTEASVGTLAELDMTHLTQGIHKQGAKVTDFLTTYGVLNSYWSALQGLRRYDGGDSSKLKGGQGENNPAFQSVFGDIPITPDWSCPKGTLYALNKGELYFHQLGDWEWMDKSGSMWQQVPNKDAYSATMFQYSNIGTFRRNAHGKLSGITEA